VGREEEEEIKKVIMKDPRDKIVAVALVRNTEEEKLLNIPIKHLLDNGFEVSQNGVFDFLVAHGFFIRNIVFRPSLPVIERI
jgi:hypothetical protein